MVTSAVYYDALLEEKPFKEVLDYTQSIHLIADGGVTTSNT